MRNLLLFLLLFFFSHQSFAGVKGLITVNEVEILEVDNDPSTSGGTVAPTGSIALSDSGSVYKKTSSTNTDWAKIANEELLQFNKFSPYPNFTVVANTTTQWANTDKYLQIFTGSTTGQIVKLPDATTLQNGWTYKIWNSSSTLVTFQNYSSTTVCKVSPTGWTYINLQANTTAAGTWSCVKASSISFDNATNGFAALNVQSAIEEAKQNAEGFPRAGVMGTYNGTVSANQWMGPNELLPNTPLSVFPIKIKLNEITWSNQPINVQFRITVRKNSKTNPILYTLTVTSPNAGYGYVTNVNITFDPGDIIWVQYLDDGTNCSDMALNLWISRIP